MFMSAREIHSQYQPLDKDRHVLPPATLSLVKGERESDNDVYVRKYNESLTRKHGAGTLHESVLKEGVHTPIILSTEDIGSRGRNQILGGHHRMAVMGMHKPDTLMPVEHFKTYDEAAEHAKTGKTERRRQK